MRVRFRDVYNLKDPNARGRVCMLVSASLQSVIAYFMGGIFYAGFLSGYGIDLVNFSIIAFVPSIAGSFALLAPQFLTRFKKRRWTLAVFKFVYYFCFLVAVTVMPELITDPTGRLAAILVLVFTGSAFNSIAIAGYSAWHIRFMPESMRSFCLGISQFLGALISGITVFISGWVSDSLAAMAEKQLEFIVTMRYVAFGLGLIDILMNVLPREVDYPFLHTPRFSDIFSIPVKNKKFMMTMVIVTLVTFEEGLTGSTLGYYLLNEIHVTYSFFNLIILLYAPFFLLCLPLWRRIIEKTSWFVTFAIGMAVVGPLQIVYGFVQPEYYIPLLLAVRLPQHFMGVGHNVAFANFPYVNMPDTNRTCYASFYQIASLVGTVFGMITATVFHALVDDKISFTAFGYTYRGGMPWLLFAAGTIMTSLCLYIVIFRKKLEPDPPAAAPAAAEGTDTAEVPAEETTDENLEQAANAQN
ncbi:MAG: MFS transporter [Clostridia bacterium]|nr:MFS transporter [Clostridia bacterium]